MEGLAVPSPGSWRADRVVDNGVRERERARERAEEAEDLPVHGRTSPSDRHRLAARSTPCPFSFFAREKGRLHT